MSAGNLSNSSKKQVRSALERIDAIEAELPKLIAGINEALMNEDNRRRQLAGIIEAIVEILGAETVDGKVKEISDRQTMARLEQAKAALVAGLEEGKVVKVVDISEQSLIVGRELDSKGEVIFPGQLQLTYTGVKPEYQEKLLGQAAGFVLQTDSGTFEVLEVYDIVEPAPAPASEAVIDATPVES
jgi:hypothetical protein